MVSPFLKWAGAKTRCMPALLRCLPSPEAVECLIEPFTGSASVFLNTRYRQYVLGDSNRDLIETYRYARDAPGELISALRRLWRNGNSEQAWLDNRRMFNMLPYGPEKSALFIYLNRHGFNGLCRYNRKGEFNVPFGRPSAPYLPEHEILVFARKAARCHVSFFHLGFEQTLQAATSGMFSALRCGIYCDPPYLPYSDTADFTGYTGAGFEIQDHRRLAAQLLSLHQCTGVPVVISASDTVLSRDIYGHFALTELSVNRSVSAVVHARRSVTELTGSLYRT